VSGRKGDKLHSDQSTILKDGRKGKVEMETTISFQSIDYVLLGRFLLSSK
jgi:hypothetical protein